MRNPRAWPWTCASSPSSSATRDNWVEADMALASLGALRGEDTMAALRGAQEAAERAGFGLLEAWAYLTITNAPRGQRPSRPRHSGGPGGPGPGQAARPGPADRGVDRREPGRVPDLGRALGRGTLEILDEVLGLDLSPLGRFGPLVIRAQIAVARGDQATAERMLDELRSLPARVQAESQRLLSLARIEIDARLARGDLAGALDAGERPVSRWPAYPRYLWPLLATAMRACAETNAASLPPEACDPGRLRKDLELRAGSTDRAGPVHDAWAATFAAEAARADACADDRPDLAAWDAAASAWAALAQPQQEAYALLLLRGPRLQPVTEKARPPGSAARPIWPFLGARPLLEQIGSVARRAGIHAPALPGPRGHVEPGEPRRSGSPSANSKYCAWWPPPPVTAISPPSS